MASPTVSYSPFVASLDATLGVVLVGILSRKRYEEGRNGS
jgi:hypothetical protein